jgi:predicted GNAT family N-acyltransferase
MNYVLSKFTKKLDTSEIKEICILKDTQWNYGVKSQLKWFTKNIKPNDVHILLKIDNNLIGYTSLRKKTFKIKANSKNLERERDREREYWLFDTHIVKKDFRGMGYNKILMNEASKIIKKKIGLLICSDTLIQYYKKFKWNLVSNKIFKILDHPFSSNVMLYNNQSEIKFNKNKIIYNFYINK